MVRGWMRGLAARNCVGLACGLFTGFMWGCGAYDEPLPPNPGVVTQDVPPPPISGGTLAVMRGADVQDLAVASDPDRDRVWIVDLANARVRAEIPLASGDEPGRVVEGSRGLAFVALRSSGAVAVIDVAKGAVIDRRDVCAAPRGLAYDAPLDALHVACAGGELVTLRATGGAPLRSVRLDPDLRDVVVEGEWLYVSRFRAAEVLMVSSEGALVTRRSPQRFIPAAGIGQEFVPAVAWRMVALPEGGVALAHQRAMSTPIVLTTPAYYSAAGCDSSIVHATVSTMREDGDQGAAATIPFAALPVDMAISPDGRMMAMVAAGSDKVFEASRNAFESEAGSGDCSSRMVESSANGQPVAVSYDDRGRLILQTREPATIVVGAEGGTIVLPGPSRWDTGHDMFHRSPNVSAPTSVACASCHPEGRDDGRTWQFDPIGPRRTQTVSGGVLRTAPFHWDGDLDDMDAFMSEVFVRRMSGSAQSPHRVRAFAGWLDAIPALPSSPPVDEPAVARGRALFHGATVACASCHSGEAFTNGETVDVGTGKAFQVPSLVGIASRGPFMHDGCAPTLRDRFSACGGGDKHGRTSHLSAEQLSDLVAFLETL